MATKVVATATVRALKGRKLLPTRAALTLVRRNCKHSRFITVDEERKKNVNNNKKELLLFFGRLHRRYSVSRTYLKDNRNM